MSERASATDRFPASPLARLFPVHAGETGMALISALLHLLILASYYLLRPLREEIGSTHREAVSTLWTIVFVVMLGVVPLYAWVVSRWRRSVALTGVFVFFVLNLLVANLLLRRLHGGALAWCEKSLYIWISVFGLFGVTVFWSLAADAFRNEQGKRLFGLIAAGGSLGAIAGSAGANLLLLHLRRIDLLLVAAALLALATVCLWVIAQRAPNRPEEADADRPAAPLSGNVWRGFVTVFRSPYLIGISLFLFLHSLGSTFLYYEKLHLVDAAIVDRARRAAFFARVDLYANVATITAQALLLAHLLRHLGVGLTLLARPVVTFAGYLFLGLSLLRIGRADAAGAAQLNTVFFALVAFEVIRRAVNYALAKPTREILFTVVDRDAKYKSKAFIDTVVYRGSDVVHGWFFTGLVFCGLSLGGIALVAVPFAALSGAVALYLGRTQENLRATTDPATPRRASSTAAVSLVAAD